MKDIPFVKVHVDDVIIGLNGAAGKETLEKHFKHLCLFFEKIEEMKSVPMSGESEFFIPEVDFCGQNLCGQIERLSPGTINAIQDWDA